VNPPVIVNTLLYCSLSPSKRKKFTEDSLMSASMRVGKEYRGVVQISFWLTWENSAVRRRSIWPLEDLRGDDSRAGFRRRSQRRHIAVGDQL
jgi:hypothetical protein